MTEKENPALKLWHWFTAGQNAWNIATSSGVTLLVVKLFPADWTTGIPWLVSIFTFSSTWSVFRLLRNAYDKYRRWKNPASMQIAVSSGVKATIRLTHKGEPTKYSADGRIVTLLDGGAVNPAEQLFRCQLQFKGTEGAWETTLEEDDWAHIVLGEVAHTEGQGSVLAVRRGPQNQRLIIPDCGAIMEYVIRARPALASGKTVVKQFRIIRNGQFVTATEEPEHV